MRQQGIIEQLQADLQQLRQEFEAHKKNAIVYNKSQIRLITPNGTWLAGTHGNQQADGVVLDLGIASGNDNYFTLDRRPHRKAKKQVKKRAKRG